jgi:thiol-disulfide isomerase/thioredoxin
MRPLLISLVLGCTLFVAAFSTVAQSVTQPKSYPVVGETCPEISLDYLKYGPKVSSLRDLRGKWVLLDFWAKSCSGCVASFPKLNSIQKELGDKLQIILIGNNDVKNKGIQPMFEKFRVRDGLELPVLYDSTLFKQYGVHGIPHVVIIEPNGVVHEVTYGDAITVETMRALLDGKPVRFFHLQSLHEANAQSQPPSDERTERNQILTG